MEDQRWTDQKERRAERLTAEKKLKHQRRADQEVRQAYRLRQEKR